MTSRIHTLTFALVACLAAPCASARETAATATSAPRLDCKAVTSYPGATLTFEQCETRNTLNAQMSQAMSQSDGEQPGDERMTCEQVIAELKAKSVPGVTAQHAAEASVAGQRYQAAYEGSMATATALATAGAGKAATAAAIDAVTGTNIAGAANTTAQTVATKALQAEARATIVPARQRAAAANISVQADVVAMMRANPRIGRLTMLAQSKGCVIQ